MVSLPHYIEKFGPWCQVRATLVGNVEMAIYLFEADSIPEWKMMCCHLHCNSDLRIAALTRLHSVEVPTCTRAQVSHTMERSICALCWRK